MHYNSRKEQIIRIASHLFLRSGCVSQTRVDSILREGIHPDVFDDPALAVDHLRVGLVEFRLLERDSDGGGYRIDMEQFQSDSNIRGIFGAEYPTDKIKNPTHLCKKIIAHAKHLEIIAG